MKIGLNLLQGRFIQRLNRFAALVELDGKPTLVHVANSGRMHELLQWGNRVFVAPMPGENRKTAYDLALVDLGFTLTSADARLPTPVLQEAIAKGRLPQFTGYERITREVSFGKSRLDLLLEGTSGRCFIEVKSVTLVVDGVGLFPDAPTTRGTKHLYSLREAVQNGYRAAVVFVVQRCDVRSFSPNDPADGVFGKALREVADQGVEVYAYRCRVSQQEIQLDSELPVLL